jgi:hypothetical protein
VQSICKIVQRKLMEVMTRFLLTAMVGMLTVSTFARLPLEARGASGHRRVAGDVRRIDFQNFTYESGGEEIRVKRGRGVYKTSGDADASYSVERVKTVYGDLTGDGRDEAVVILYYTGGGTGAFSKGFLFAVRKGRMALLTTFEGGDRADGGIRDVAIKDGLLSVRRNEPERMKEIPVGLCCPAYLITTKYKWDGKELVRFGEPQKVEVGPDSDSE